MQRSRCRMEKDRNRINHRIGRNGRAELCLQLALVVIGIAALMAMPGKGGDVLLIPISGTLATTVNLALANEARLIEAVPSVGGVIVSGDGWHMMRPMLGQGTLVIGVPAVFCGSSSLSNGVAA